MSLNIVDRHQPREYSAISSDGGIVLCVKQPGAFLVLRFPEDLERLKRFLETLEVKRGPAV